MKQINKHKSVIRTTLMQIGAITGHNIEIFSEYTRDRKVNVYKDMLSEVIFIDDYYVGDHEYESGKYRDEFITNFPTLIQSADYEDLTDTERRYNSYKKFFTGKVLCDFGCGAGSFIRLAKSTARQVIGIELQKNYLDDMNKYGIISQSSLNESIPALDIVTLFHCFEHLPDPLSVLRELRKSLKNGGMIIIECPHARDFLIGNLKLHEFIKFTLWSQHLILHTRNSLKLMLKAAGFSNIVVHGVQRYNIANHLNWILNKRPGGHKSTLAVIETNELVAAYEKALLNIDATDTLVAIAEA